MESFQITISDWAAFSPCRMLQEEWQTWADGNEGDVAEAGYKPDLPWVSAMLRRRLSPMGRAALCGPLVSYWKKGALNPLPPFLPPGMER